MPNRLRRAVRGSLSGLAASVALVLSASTASAADPAAITDEYLFTTTLTEFTALRAQRPHAETLDWSSDGCTYSPDSPLGYQFQPACHRHDFGYRNYRRQNRMTEPARLTIDDQFRRDLHQLCAGRVVCIATAELYYAAVREFGDDVGGTAAAVDAADVANAS
ncbi:phospholipase [Umezawaea beigongshangensis]|uniref:phospholipase n=1 Tax=Umezawaea beigongshangensis TaxID=2780383 RepID=UPI0027DCB8E9|nr:phospholipase [Umezawaea beigongshangensis]